MGHVEAEGLEDGLGVGEGLLLHVLPQVVGEELAGLLELLHVGEALPELPLVHVGQVAVFFQQPGHDLVVGGGFVEGDDVVGHRVHHMDRAAVDVQHDVAAV